MFCKKSEIEIVSSETENRISFICVFLYTIVNWIMRIKIYSICQHLFLPVYVCFSKCWHILNEYFQHVILRILKTMIPKLIIKIKYSKYKLDLLTKCQKYIYIYIFILIQPNTMVQRKITT
jgi:hypothetical protein